MPLSIEIQRHRQVEVEGLSIHAAECGNSDRPGVLLLHGWPEDWSACGRVMLELAKSSHVVAIDLPGVGLSVDAPPANDKRTIARLVRGVAAGMSMHDVTVVGQDVGGMIAYAYLRAFPGELQRVVIMDTVIPGVAPWAQVIRNPYIWHFAFHSVPELPEILVADHIRQYFDFFYDALASRHDSIPSEARSRYVRAYSQPSALHTGFEWYRAFAQDAKDNEAVGGEVVDTPVLYLRGSAEQGDIADYLDGFRANGIRDVRGEIIADSGHFAMDEQPDAVVSILQRFIGGEDPR